MLNVPEQIKQLYKADGVRKNCRISFPNGEYRDLVNSDIVEESAQFTESTTTSGAIKLGISESSVFECEIVDIPQIRGYVIDVYNEIDISSCDASFIEEYGQTSDDVDFPFYRIPLGEFIVDEYKQKAEDNHARIIAYDALALRVLHVDMRQDILDLITSEGYNGLKKIFYYLMPESEWNDVSETDWMNNISVTTTHKSLTGAVQYGGYPSTRYDSDLNVTYYGTGTALHGVVEYDQITLTFGDAPSSDKYKSIIKNNSIIVSDDYYSAVNQTGESLYFASVIYGMTPTGTIGNDYKWENSNSITFKIVKKVILYKGSKYIETTSRSAAEARQAWEAERANQPQPMTHNIAVNSSVDISNCRYKTIYSPTSFLTNGFDLTLSSTKVNALDYVYYSDFISSLAEMFGCFCKINRQTKELDMYDLMVGFTLYPSDDLYPSDELYPADYASAFYYKSEYSECDYQDYLTRPIGKVSVTLGGNDYTVEVPDYDPNDYSEIELDSNNLVFACTTYDNTAINTIIEQVLNHVKGIYFRPFDMRCLGLPYMESGDVIKIQTQNGFVETFIMRRTLSGIQQLSDNLEATGEE